MQLASSVPYVSEDIPVLPRSAAAVNTERECGSRGSLGRFPALEAMPLMLAHAGKLMKFGA